MKDFDERFVNQRYDDTIFVECNCGDDEHIMIWRMDSKINDYDLRENYPPEFYVSYYLSQYLGFWQRAWLAIRYLFGYKSRYGDFGCISMTPVDADKLIDFLQRYKNVCQQWYVNKKQIPLFDMKEIEKESNIAKEKEEKK